MLGWIGPTLQTGGGRTFVQMSMLRSDILSRLAARRGLVDTDGGGRRVLGAEASRRIRAIRQKCPEDFDSLARRLETAVQAI